MRRSPATGRRVSGGQAGFSLVELMVAMALFAMLSVGMLTTVSLYGRTQRSTQAIDVAQAGVRASLELIARDVEMASAGSRSGTVFLANGAQPQLLAVRLTDNSATPDRLDLILVDPSAQATLMASYSTGQTTLSVSSTAGFAVGDLVQVSDLVTGVVVQVTAVGATSLTIASNANPLPRAYPAGAWVFRSRQVTYFVDSTAYGAQNPLLMFDPDGPGARAAEPLAEGVEDFQVALGFDANSDGLISNNGAGAGDDEWIGNVAGEVAPATLTTFRSARITLVARTVLPGSGTRGSRPAVENHPAGSGADSYARRVLKSEITVRNFNL